ncbi:MAG: hypothetical protein QOJ98_1512 [Acidobacteriota bacterium]|jgi:uncharacterized protein with HEPN domain|nr:hypothetical protein [Acidobacteriota bacterium]
MNHLELLERKSRLWHIEQAASKIVSFTAEKTPEDYASDDMLRDAVEMQLIRIGEALPRALKVHPELARYMSDTSQIVSLRDQLMDDPQTDATRVWGVIKTDVPVLLREVRTLLATS